MKYPVKLIMSCLAFTPWVFAAEYRFVKIDFPHATFTVANGINARGDIVGRCDDVKGVGHGFLLHKGVFSTIDFPHASLTAPRAINARGDVAGRINDVDGVEHGFLLRDGQFTQIDYPGASITTARGINNAGDITGRHFDAEGNESGFILKDGVFKDIHIPGGFTSDVWSAQDNERVMVGDAAMRPDFPSTASSERKRVTSNSLIFPVYPSRVRARAGLTSKGILSDYLPTSIP